MAKKTKKTGKTTLSEFTKSIEQIPYYDENGKISTLDDVDQASVDRMMPIKISTPQRLRELVNAKKKTRKNGVRFTQKIIANKLGVSEQTLSEWLRDDYEGRYRDNNLKMLADYFDVDVAYLKCEQMEKRKEASEDPARARSRALEGYLKTIGYSFDHGYGLDSDGSDPYYPTAPEFTTEIISLSDTDDKGNEKEGRYCVDGPPEYPYPYGKPLMVTLPSGDQILLRENTFDRCCGEFEEWAEFALTKLLAYGRQQDIMTGKIPAGEENL